MSVVKYVTSAKIEDEGSAAKSLIGFVFWSWGVIGMVIMAASIANLPSNVGVGTSAYFTLLVLFWIGGMVLFGFGGLLVGSKFEFNRPE